MGGIGKVLFRVVMGMIDLMLRTLVLVTSPFFAWMYEPKRGKLKPVKDGILLKPAAQIAKMIRQREVSCVTVLETFMDHIVEVNKHINAVIAERFTPAMKEAKKIDDLLDSGNIPEEYSEENAPYLGVPFTAKEAMAIIGLPNSSGLLSRKDVISKHNADVVANMQRAGGIPVALTNVSELCMWYESSNLLYGRSNNAYHHGRIVGGSSGGEGCLLSAAGSVIGIGSDIGGSIRLPAFMNGVFGHKPTKGIISNKGQFPAADGEAADFLSTGPMCRYAEDLLPMFKVLMQGTDVSKLKLGQKVEMSSLRVHYMLDDGGSYIISRVDPQIKEAISKAVAHLKSQSASVECVAIHDLRHSFDIWACKMSTGQVESFCSLMGGGTPVSAPWELMRWFMLRPRHTLPAIGLGLTENIPYPPEMVKKLKGKCEYLKQQFRDMLKDDGVFIYPTFPRPAPYHNQPLTTIPDFAYTGIFNVLGLPSTHVPMGLSKEGVPIGFQVVSNYHNDHLSIAVARELEKAFGGWVPPFEITNHN